MRSLPTPKQADEDAESDAEREQSGPCHHPSSAWSKIIPTCFFRAERSSRTHTEEFYEVTELEWTVPAVNRQLRQRVYNTVRPHQALGYRTPQEFLRDLVRAG